MIYKLFSYSVMYYVSYVFRKHYDMRLADYFTR